MRYQAEGEAMNTMTMQDVADLAKFPAKKSPPLVYICGTQTFSPSAEEKKVLKQYLTERHGMILGDHLGGTGFHKAFITKPKKKLI